MWWQCELGVDEWELFWEVEHDEECEEHCYANGATKIAKHAQVLDQSVAL